MCTVNVKVMARQTFPDFTLVKPKGTKKTAGGSPTAVGFLRRDDYLTSVILLVWV